MKKLSIVTAVFLACGTSTTALAEHLHAKLTGYQEVPAVSTAGSGEFTAQVSQDDKFIDYEMTFGGLQASITQSHIHVAQRSVNGSIVIWLCQTPAGTPPFTDPTHLSPTCPQSGTVTGTITSANVIAGSMTPQQLTAGDLADVIKAIRAGVAYANVHTSVSPGGEIRGQIRALHRDGDDDDNRD